MCAVCKDNDEEIERCRIREKRLVEMVEEGQQSIERLEKEIDNHSEEKRDLTRRLIEVEKKAGEKEMSEDPQRMSDL